VSDERYEQDGRNGQAGAIRCCEHIVLDSHSAGAWTAGATKHTRMAAVTEHLGMAGAAKYVDAAGKAVPIGTDGVARYAVRSGPAGIVRQYMSDGHYEPIVCSRVNAGVNSAGIADGACGVACLGARWLCLGGCMVSRIPLCWIRTEFWHL